MTTSAGYQLLVDEPVSAGGSGTGPMPTDYLLAAMSSCFALAMAWAAGKRAIKLPDLAVTATGTYDGPKFSQLTLTVATSAPVEVVSRLIKPALAVCYVSNTIASAAPIGVVIAGVACEAR